MQLTTRIRSMVMRHLASAATLERQRQSARKKSRREHGGDVAVHYFHDPIDPYSYLAVQVLDALRDAYAVRFIVHLVSGPGDAFQGDTDRFTSWAHRDAADVAPFYGLDAPGVEPLPADVRHTIGSRLAALSDDEAFAQQALEMARDAWAGSVNGTPTTPAFEAGNQLRERLGHYFGAMFYFEGEWFWGIDRLPRLEERLTEEGHRRSHANVVTEPQVDLPYDQGHIRLEYFPSLRSPYTAVGHARVVDVAARTGVELVLRPVMPMMMRGVPAPRAKQRYIITDAAREARAHDVPFGNFVDPFGEPVRKAFALFPAAERSGKGMEFVTSYLARAWADGIDVTTDGGLRTVAERAGIDWAQLRQEAAGDDWQRVLDANVADMLDFGLWGVPSFRVTSEGDDSAFCCWGQDRIWRVAAEIDQRAR